MKNANRNRVWKKKGFYNKASLLLIFLLISIFIFLSYISHIPKSLSSISTTSRCTPQILSGHRLLWYAPHSGFSNQLSEFKNAILMAAILNRTLVVPPILDHHAVALGSCPKFRVSGPAEIRVSVWDHVIDLLRSRRYLSMADIIDLSSLVSTSVIRTIDFRDFISLWCGLNIDFACFNESNAHSSLLNSLKQCGSLLSGLDGNIGNCIYALDEDCRTTVWTYQQNNDGVLDSFQPDEQLKKKKKISYVRKRQDVYKTLGPGSEAELATVLAFGSLFTAPYKGSELYIDIHESPRDQRINSLIQKIEYLPFVPIITSAGKEYAFETIKVPFLCAQLRLLDGQFKNHWKATFLALKEKVDSLRKGPLPISIFVMTDLPQANWTGSYLGDLARDSDSVKLYVLRENDALVVQTAKKLVDAGHGMRFGLGPASLHRMNKQQQQCPPHVSPDILLYIEETVCSCASLGFIGTAGSTIAESVESLRKFNKCPSQIQTTL